MYPKRIWPREHGQRNRRAERQRPHSDMRHREQHHHRHGLRRIRISYARHVSTNAKENLRKRER